MLSLKICGKGTVENRDVQSLIEGKRPTTRLVFLRFWASVVASWLFFSTFSAAFKNNVVTLRTTNFKKLSKR